MGFIIDSITPKDTEEIKPGLFVQQTKTGWRCINPLAWKGKFRTKEQLLTIISPRVIISLAIIIGLVLLYINDTSQLLNFYQSVTDDPVGFCEDVAHVLTGPICTPEQQAQGLCFTDDKTGIINVSKILNG